uniref:Ras-GEF domain-containing protein n=2 Tax=Paramoeba aestuarina TaxID=180227 RepID=A0A7S4NAX9_9EUKA|mmetsp:Transcript_13541/g.20943  ORF Transcript_13541/g.20943 Transcript_13541/m.20943 type:complete len:225 (+) Transcript_13541:287-961(+)
MIKLSTKVSSWVISELVKRVKIRDRVFLFEKFVLLSEILLDLNNFSGCMAVLGGLGSSAFYRMKKTWGEIDRDVIGRYEKIRAIMSHRSSYGAYRAYVKGVVPPGIPYIGVSLSDLTFMYDGNPDPKDGEGLLNFKRWILMARVIEDVKLFQKASYDNLCEPGESTQFFHALNNFETLGERQTHQYSKIVDSDDGEGMETLLKLYEESVKKVNDLEKKIGREKE